MSDLDPTRPKWPQIVDRLTQRISSGQYGPGHLISHRAIEEEFGVAKATAGRALAKLRARKPVRTEFGMGSFIRDVTDQPAPGNE
ncbi:GntR family transcriptional regulator [Streptomyces sp. BE20]|uniref:GntR family transcriptional regulator n=1 Tax=Streptomyces sp. BE20 TaxID=3002525 RepID=UPI002E761EF6|nr:GntR family transcriptional regulator [Streptomyces sp. BE20]MEE1822006.1 GntR family transcriptional regulator [Streptomyces sp. BE20]